MKTISLYFIFSMLTGNPILAIILVFVFYAFVDKMYFRLLPDFLAPFKRSRLAGRLLTEIRVNPANAKAALDLGVVYFEKKKYEKALYYLKKANERTDDSARLYLYMGMTLYEMGQTSEGANSITRALEIDKGVNYGLPYVYLMGYELASGDNREKLKVLEECFDRYGNTENFNHMGKIYKKKGNREKAKEMFEHSLNNYSYCPRSLRKMHRKWAFSSWVNKLTL
jgi:tetratricopeptide (TPR) repeat protein